MDQAEILGELDRERRSLFLDGSIGEQLAETVRVRGVYGDWHVVAWSSLAPERADLVIQETVAHYRSLGAEVEWTAYSHDGPSDLVERLRRRGFEIGPKEVVMVLDLEHCPEWVTAPAAFEVVRVSTPEELDLFSGVSSALGGSDLVVKELGRALATGSTQHLGYVVLDGARAVSIGRLYTHPASSFGGLYGGATLESERGRGCYRASVAQRARDARELGARYLRVDALPTSLPILDRLGFAPVTEAWPCVLHGGVVR